MYTRERKIKSPNLPGLLKQKIYKTGQTRGADDDVIFQNRVGRNSTVLIPYHLWKAASAPPKGDDEFENGFIALISPTDYFEDASITQKLARDGLMLGVNALVFYETRDEWNKYNPERQGWRPAASRTDPLGGQYAARVPGTTAASEGDEIIRGYNTRTSKGAGIRIYEYASKPIIDLCRLQLEFLFWHCIDASDIATAQEMSISDIALRQDDNAAKCKANSLDDLNRLIQMRLINNDSQTICPLCLEAVSSAGFFNKVAQAEGRIVPDLTITQLNLFHIKELRFGYYGHQPYNLGWGHHHCNVVVKDSGIEETIIWMDQVIDRNIQAGHLIKG